eukprot:7909464-Alexandrium_andersonii.AAC.1
MASSPFGGGGGGLGGGGSSTMGTLCFGRGTNAMHPPFHCGGGGGGGGSIAVALVRFGGGTTTPFALGGGTAPGFP